MRVRGEVRDEVWGGSCPEASPEAEAHAPTQVDSRRVSFGLFKCADMLGAYAAAKGIITNYASGKSEMSEIDLEGAKSTVAYGIIAGNGDDPHPNPKPNQRTCS